MEQIVADGADTAKEELIRYVDKIALQKQRYEVHTKIGMISLFTLSIPKTV